MNENSVKKWILKAESDLKIAKDELLDWRADELTDYAVSVRYGDDFYFPSEKEASEAVDLAERVKEFVLDKLKNSGLNFS